MATIRLPAEAESYRVETIAQGRRTQVRFFVLESQCEEFSIMEEIINMSSNMSM